MPAGWQPGAETFKGLCCWVLLLLLLLQGGGGGMPNPFDMGKLMESVKKAQQMVQVETQRVQAELEA